MLSLFPVLLEGKVRGRAAGLAMGCHRRPVVCLHADKSVDILSFAFLVREPQSVSPMRYFVEPIVVEGVPQGKAPKPSYPCGICNRQVGRKAVTNLGRAIRRANTLILLWEM